MASQRPAATTPKESNGELILSLDGSTKHFSEASALKLNTNEPERFLFSIYAQNGEFNFFNLSLTSQDLKPGKYQVNTAFYRNGREVAANTAKATVTLDIAQNDRGTLTGSFYGQIFDTTASSFRRISGQIKGLQMLVKK